MTMLSRVADRLYWKARYLERAQDTARVTEAYSHLIMDIPEGTEPGWDILVRILDAEPVFTARARAFSEQNVLKFLIADMENPGSIQFSIRAARENMRTTRDVLPEETWEQVNALHIYAQERAEKSIGRRARYQFLEDVIARCQGIDGLIQTTLRRDHAYRFIKLGHLLERADMTTRIIDVGAGILLGKDNPNETVEALVWASLLKSLSTMGAYRRHVGPLVEANAVVSLVFHDRQLPRSVRFCLDGIRQELQGLSNNRAALKVLERCRRRLSRFDPERASTAELHAFIDRFQLDLNGLNDVINETWFLPTSS